MSALIVFIQKAIAQGIGMLFGATGEIITEKSGNLNLGVPGLMYMGGIAGIIQDPCYRRCFIFLWFYDLFRHYTGNPCFMVYV